MTTITIQTRRYEFSHGRKPRGRGHWAFDVQRRAETQTVFAPGCLTITEAKAWLRDHLRGDRNVIEVQVAP